MRTPAATATTTPNAAPQFWRSLDEYANDPEWVASVNREFPAGAEWWIDKPSRRAFLKRMGASLALAGLVGCDRQPPEKIVPYVETPEALVPGVPLHYATAMPRPGGAIGIVVESHGGRPTKIEGNAQHPSSLGATDVLTQASVLDLYDPHRSQTVQRRGRLAGWSQFLEELQPRLAEHVTRSGRGLHLVTEGIGSPTAARLLDELLTQYPEARWYQYDSAVGGNQRTAMQQVFGQAVEPQYQLADADVILAIDADFLGSGAAQVRLAREFASRRVVDEPSAASMNRLYSLEPSPTITGAKADHCLRVSPTEIESLLIRIAAGLGVNVQGLDDAEAGESAAYQNWVDAIVADLQSAAGRSAVLAGQSQSPRAHALVAAINEQLGNVGTTVTYVPPADQVAERTPGTIEDFSSALDAGEVETVFLLSADIAQYAPADLKLPEKIRGVPFSVHHGLYRDATSSLCTWHLPATHYLEEWGDARAEGGVVSLIQPLIQRLYDGRSTIQVLDILLGRAQDDAMAVVQQTWQSTWGDRADFHWKKSLHDGVIEGTAAEAADVTFSGNGIAGLEGASDSVNGTGDWIAIFRNDPAMFDGRYATNGWLQELPAPISKLTWGNAAWVSPVSAKEQGWKSGDIVEVSTESGSVKVPIWIQPGQPEEVITLWAGHGREIEGADTVGVNVNPLRTSGARWHTSVRVQSTGDHIELATTQHHHLMENRGLIRAGTIDEFRENPEHPSFMDAGHHGASHDEGDAPAAPENHPVGEHDHEHEHPHREVVEKGPSLYPDMPQVGPQWGMTVNLSACTGCNACVIACQSENNVPIVGADQVRRGREMHWLRVDSYFEGAPEEPEILHQPVMCMHCEHAPCEPVCPVAATTHSESGLNEMTYNRCIGTRYCSNNCPYKVRRFNFLDFREETKEYPVLQLLQNPDVTVRSRGVMEKCTYCVQRINHARINAKMDGREIEDGEVVTACQAVCPTQAISFGNIADENSQVRQTKLHPLNYGILTELNTRPRTSYHAVLRNPNPALESAEEHS